MTIQLRSGRLQLQTGERKINAATRRFAGRMQVDRTASIIEMTRIGENIHATYPPYAMVCTHLARMGGDRPSDRGTTSNTGATDADGR